jgi:hypothetical protein
MSAMNGAPTASGQLLRERALAALEHFWCPGRAATRVGGRRWQQRLDALPQLVRQQVIGQGGHERRSSHHQHNQTHHPHPRFRNVLSAPSGG